MMAKGPITYIQQQCNVFLIFWQYKRNNVLPSMHFIETLAGRRTCYCLFVCLSVWDPLIERQIVIKHDLYCFMFYATLSNNKAITVLVCPSAHLSVCQFICPRTLTLSVTFFFIFYYVLCSYLIRVFHGSSIFD